MLDQIFAFLSPVLGLAAEKYGPLGTVLAYLFLFVLPMCSLVIELVEAIAKFTENTDDDVKAAALKAKYAALVKYLEFLPHVNLPLAPMFLKVLQWTGKLVAIVKSVLTK